MKSRYKKTGRNTRFLIFFSLIILAPQYSCKKLVAIKPPVASITTGQVFADSADAVAAVNGIYSAMINTNVALTIGNGAATVYCGESADELLPFYGGDHLSTNSLINSDAVPYDRFWAFSYKYIYQINASIEGISSSTGITQSTKNQLIGETKFLWAFHYFYLVNLFGDVPLITSSDYRVNVLKAKSPKSLIYNQIVAYLKDAQNLLPADYSVSGGEHIRANRLAATALLARVYLYMGDYSNAEKQASEIISNSNFGLNPDLNSVFLANNSEAILQWNLNTAFRPFNATTEGYSLISNNSTSPVNYYLNDQLLKAFEKGDLRRKNWIDSSIYSGRIYYFPYKYKIGPAQQVPGSTATEYYMVLRLAEQYLIRAEAEANGTGGGMPAAVTDLNTIRNRAGLTNYAGQMLKDPVLSAIAHERQIELFAEWGQRWLDLKRTGKIDSVMKIATPLKSGGLPWKSYQQLYPIPKSEIQADPELVQNPGY